jgi:hypothetical protein
MAPEARQERVSSETPAAAEARKGAGEYLRTLLARVGAWRAAVAVAVAVTVVAAVAYGLGAWSGGAQENWVEQRYLQRQVEILEQERRASTAELARLRTEQQVDREAYAQIEQQLGELQAKIIEQQEELAFYRGVVSGPGDGGLSIRDFSLVAGEKGVVRMSFVLAQLKQGQREVRGQLQVRLEGVREGKPAGLDAAILNASGEPVRLPFAFRYFQDIALDIRLPSEFAAERVVVRVLPTTRGVPASVESFPWRVSSG